MRTVAAWTISGICAALALACSSEPLDRPNGDALSTGDDDKDAGDGDGDDDDDDEDGITCAGFVKALTDCGLATGSRFAGCADDRPALPCVTACIAKASCEEVGAAYCDSSPNSFAECLGACQMAMAPPPFVCNDGLSIPPSWKCDGADDCEGGEDEDCPAGTFTCEDGLNVPAGWQCDGVGDCEAGEDEFGCPGSPTVACNDGTSVPASRDCDGVAHCGEGEDEIDCLKLTCE